MSFPDITVALAYFAHTESNARQHLTFSAQQASVDLISSATDDLFSHRMPGEHTMQTPRDYDQRAASAIPYGMSAMFVVLSVLFSLPCCKADTVELTDGSQMKGSVSDFGRVIKVETAMGKVSIPRQKIKRIVKDSDGTWRIERHLSDLENLVRTNQSEDAVRSINGDDPSTWPQALRNRWLSIRGTLSNQISARADAYVQQICNQARDLTQHQEPYKAEASIVAAVSRFPDSAELYDELIALYDGPLRDREELLNVLLRSAHLGSTSRLVQVRERISGECFRQAAMCHDTTEALALVAIGSLSEVCGHAPNKATPPVFLRSLFLRACSKGRGFRAYEDKQWPIVATCVYFCAGQWSAGSEVLRNLSIDANTWDSEANQTDTSEYSSDTFYTDLHKRVTAVRSIRLLCSQLARQTLDTVLADATSNPFIRIATLVDSIDWASFAEAPFSSVTLTSASTVLKPMQESTPIVRSVLRLCMEAPGTSPGDQIRLACARFLLRTDAQDGLAREAICREIQYQIPVARNWLDRAEDPGPLNAIVQEMRTNASAFGCTAEVTTSVERLDEEVRTATAAYASIRLFVEAVRAADTADSLDQVLQNRLSAKVGTQQAIQRTKLLNAAERRAEEKLALMRKPQQTAVGYRKYMIYFDKSQYTMAIPRYKQALSDYSTSYADWQNRTRRWNSMSPRQKMRAAGPYLDMAMGGLDVTVGPGASPDPPAIPALASAEDVLNGQTPPTMITDAEKDARVIVQNVNAQPSTSFQEDSAVPTPPDRLAPGGLFPANHEQSRQDDVTHLVSRAKEAAASTNLAVSRFAVAEAERNMSGQMSMRSPIIRACEAEQKALSNLNLGISRVPAEAGSDLTKFINFRTRATDLALNSMKYGDNPRFVADFEHLSNMADIVIKSVESGIAP